MIQKQHATPMPYDQTKLITSFEKGTDPAVIAEAVEHANGIRRALRLEDAKLEEVHKTYEEAEEEWRTEVSAIRRHDCLHTITTYEPDASGNNDSSTKCDICGMTMRKRR